MVVRLLENKHELTANKSTQSNIGDGDQEAKQWKNYVDVLKQTVDSMREICMAKQNILGCEEALMYLTSAVRDFQSLISSIHVELEWENSENRPNTIKWEVLGTHGRKTLSTKQLNENRPISPQKDEISCVQCRAKRRMNSDLSDEENSKKTNNDVYERLAYGKRSNVARQNESYLDKQESEELRKQGCTTGKLTMPRSAMDIPQTKSSMAKIAASRQLLWQRHKKILTEKLSAKRRQEHSITLGNRRRSLPILAKQAPNVKTTTETNLESIRETHEEDKNEALGGADPDNLSTKTHAGHFKTRSDGYAFDLLDLSGDREWEALTAEEESLKLEEESLAKEIEETESISIDDELQRRVILDFSDVNIETGWQSVVDEWTIDNDDLTCDQNDIRHEVAVETPKLIQQPSRFRQPGELVQIHQRLLSPLRKRNLDVEEIQKRQTKAEELRLMLQEKKAQHLRILHLKVEDVRQKRAELLEKKRLHLESKMEKAAENRQRNLDEIIKRAKDDDQRVLETNFINTMESERVRLDLQLKEQDREQRLQNLAEERSKQSRDKAIKEAAIDERKRTAEQQKAEKLREQKIKKQERQSVIEIQRNEAAESQRKKTRLYEERLKNIKSNEMADLESLRNKIQEKSNKGTKRHEVLLERIRQKAIESSRSSNTFSSLSDCAVPPSDLQYSLTSSNCCKKCLKCNYIATSDLNLIVHLLSELHLSNCSLKLSDVNFVYLKSELENAIKLMDGSAIIDNEDLTNPNSNTLNKKLRTKIKQKLGIVDLALDFNVPNSALRQSFDKKSNELRNLMQDRQKFNEQQRKKLEHCLNDLRRFFVDQKVDIRSLLALSACQSGLITFLLDFILKSNSSGFECSSKIFYRLIGKISHFLLDILAANSKICCATLFSDCIFNLLEWTSNQIEISNGEFEERTEMLIAVYCVLLSLLQEGSKFVNSNATKHINQLSDRQQTIAMYLNNSNFITYYKHTILNGTEPMEFGFGYNLRPLNTLSNLILALNNDQKAGKSGEHHALNLHLTVVQNLVLEIYAKIRFDPIVSSDAVSSGTLMTSSLISTNSSNWHTNSNVDVECLSLLNLWNSLASDSSIKQKLLETLKDDEILRFVYILIVSICNNDKVLNLPLNENSLTFNSPSLPIILEATANFASLSNKNQIMCTIGWQKSLLVYISKLPFEYFQQPNIRFYLLTTLIVILLNNMEGIALIRDYITPTWMAEFLKEVINSKLSDEDKRRFSKYVSEKEWRCALEFFENIN